MNEDEIRDAAAEMVLDAEIHTAAAGFADLIPGWVRDLNDAHYAEAQRLVDRGHLSTAAVFETHVPMISEYGIACGASTHEDEVPYPCRDLRAHDGSEVWAELVASYPEGWEQIQDEVEAVQRGE